MKPDVDDNISKQVQRAYHISGLIAGFIKRTLTLAEQEELDEWISASDANMKMFGELTDEKNIAAFLAAFERADTEAALARVHQRFLEKKRTRKIVRYAAIPASIIIIVGLFLFLDKCTARSKKSDLRIIKQEKSSLSK